MTKTDPRDVAATVAQIRKLEAAGCDIIRVAVPDAAAARALKQIRRAIRIPLVADIHFDHRLAILALEAGADGLRLNPGNIGSARKIGEVVRAARERRVPIRIGVNAGSLEKDLLAKHGGATAEALAASALRHARILEDLGHSAIKISVKAADVARTVQAYRLLAEKTDYPLHLGVTEAGTLLSGAVRSSAALGILLAEGIGDTLRISLTEPPEQEVRVGLELLRALGLRAPGPRVISCPTCGRIRLDVVGLAHRLEAELAKLARKHPGANWPLVAVMGCVVNGPGEAREADIAVAGGNRKAALYVGGRPVATLAEADILPAVVARVRAFLAKSR
jgi:(E)-4-hydroxy-3-methylbut-2-enyl-diphosphate synthase